MIIEKIREKANSLKIEKRAFIDGIFVKAIDGEIMRKVSPVDGCDISGLQSCTEKDINKAVSAAKRSFNAKIWQEKAPQAKKEILFNLADLIAKNKEELAILDTLETGRSFKNYYYDSIPKAIEAIRYFAESIDKYYDLAIPPKKQSFATITREPMGVVGLITPWNDPLVVAAWKFSPALLMGNSLVLKPAEQSSFSILKVAKLAKEAGIPDGVFNVVTGYGDIAGKALALHNDVAGIFFTGSSEVGKLIMQYSGQSNMKRVGLECGGKSPFIISRNCKNMEKAAETLAKNIFYNQGQICSAGSRAIVHRDYKKKLIKFLKKESEKYIPNDPFDIKTEVGCVVSLDQKRKIDDYILKGKECGASMAIPEISEELYCKECSVLPTIFYDLNNESIIAREEIFGPVLVILEFDSIDEAVNIANDSKYGLSASIWTNDLDEAYHVSRKLRAGIVHINSYGDDDNSVPFGGINESGIGKDKSIFAFDEYSNLKTTWIKFNKS